MDLSRVQPSELIAEMNRRPNFPVIRQNDLLEIASRIDQRKSDAVLGSIAYSAYDFCLKEIRKLIH